jgi:Arc/MetJ-type ribon-helix-helix transcriptional regulator
MIVDLKPETERLVREELRRGNFHSLDEVIVQGVYALREKSHSQEVAAAQKSRPRKTLYELLTQPPFAGSELNFERQKDYPRPIDL